MEKLEWGDHFRNFSLLKGKCHFHFLIHRLLLKVDYFWPCFSTSPKCNVSTSNYIKVSSPVPIRSKALDMFGQRHPSLPHLWVMSVLRMILRKNIDILRHSSCRKENNSFSDRQSSENERDSPFFFSSWVLPIEEICLEGQIWQCLELVLGRNEFTIIVRNRYEIKQNENKRGGLTGWFTWTTFGWSCSTRWGSGPGREPPADSCCLIAALVWSRSTFNVPVLMYMIWLREDVVPSVWPDLRLGGRLVAQ